MTIDEIISYLSVREINSKTNNIIIAGEESKKVVDRMPFASNISFFDNDSDIDVAFNIKVDLQEIDVQNILTYILNQLKKLKLLDPFFDYALPFNNKFALIKFENILRDYRRVVQLFFYNLESLTKEDQMLFNELYYYNSLYFSAISLIENHFITYFLNQDRVLDDRENYQRYEITRPYILTKEKIEN